MMEFSAHEMPSLSRVHGSLVLTVGRVSIRTNSFRLHVLGEVRKGGSLVTKSLKEKRGDWENMDWGFLGWRDGPAKVNIGASAHTVGHRWDIEIPGAVSWRSGHFGRPALHSSYLHPILVSTFHASGQRSIPLRVHFSQDVGPHNRAARISDRTMVSLGLWLRHRLLYHLRDCPRRFDRPSGSPCRRSARNKVHSWVTSLLEVTSPMSFANCTDNTVRPFLPQFPKPSLFFLWLRTDPRFPVL